MTRAVINADMLDVIGELLAEGLSFRAIGARLGLHPTTVTRLDTPERREAKLRRICRRDEVGEALPSEPASPWDDRLLRDLRRAGMPPIETVYGRLLGTPVMIPGGGEQP